VDGAAAFGLFNGPAALSGKRLFTALNQFGDGTPMDIVHTKSFNVKNGKHLWDASLDLGPTWGGPVVAGRVVYVGKAALSPFAPPELHAFDAKTGTLLRTFTLPGQSSSGPAVVDGELFVSFGLSLLGPAPGGVRAYELP
jgi:outer membrane protein assembly factor BamB